MRINFQKRSENFPKIIIEKAEGKGVSFGHVDRKDLWETSKKESNWYNYKLGCTVWMN